MPKAAKEFVIGNRRVEAGEEFEIPDGEHAQYRENGLIEGEPPEPVAGAGAVGLSPAPLGDGAAAPGAEPAADESADDTAERGKRSGKR